MSPLQVFVFTLTISATLASIVYEIPATCQHKRPALARCAADAIKSWDVKDTDANEPNRNFCCSVWETLNCEVNLLYDCSRSYANSLTFRVEQMYGSMCEYHTRHSVSCALRWWSIMLIIIALIVIITIIAFIIHRRRRSKFSHEYITNDPKMDYLDKL